MTERNPAIKAPGSYGFLKWRRQAVGGPKNLVNRELGQGPRAKGGDVAART